VTWPRRSGMWLATRTAVVVVFLAAVQAGVQTRLINPLFVATPTTAIAGAARGLANGTLGGPMLVTGLRLGLIYILVGVVSVEYLASIGGLGKTINFAYLQFNMAQVYSAVTCVFILAAVLLAIVGRLQWMVRR
jgi:ABC-type nitrate/sulfonate/bicarbonate transport system permease component